MILGRSILTGHLIYDSGTPICRSCWNGYHHRCNGHADEWNKCECSTFDHFKDEHAASVAAGANLRLRFVAPTSTTRADKESK